MTQKKEPFYLTTAIAYTSGRPHIGNTYEIILSDAIARFKRAQGYDVFFQTGTDEHGVKIEEKAKAAGVSPQEFVDGVAAQIKSNWDLMNTSYDYFVRTTDDYHVKEVQSIFKRLYDQGDIYKGTYEGWYCTPCESFWTESQLVDGCCPDCGRPVKKAKEEAYFFNMQKYADRLIKYIEDHPDFIQPESRKNEMLNNFLRPGLQDLCVSRTSFTWGVPVDFDPKHVVYVWIDALSNYITTLGYHANGESDEKFNKYWPATHIIGKDILRFHTIYWPIILMALDLPLPKKVFGHPWLLTGSDKMSKSKGNVINPDDIVNDYGADSLRIYEMFMGDYEQDAPWSTDSLKGCKRFIDRVIRLKDKVVEGEEYSKDLEVLINKSIKKVGYDLTHMAYNTAVSTLMILVNAYDEKESITKGDYRALLDLLNPIAPHITEELNESLGYTPICDRAWPTYDEDKTIDNEIDIAVQVNGKVRDTIRIKKDSSKEELEKLAMDSEIIKKWLEGKEIVKVICVPNRIVNIVIR